jgi:outer membrane receptor protein involved in Fe transport
LETVAIPCGYTFEANAGDARSHGPEIDAKLTPNWSLAASSSYTNAQINHPSATFVAAVLTNPVPGEIPGCESATHCSIPILNVPKKSASLSAIYSPCSTAMGARLGLSSDKWTATLFIDNLTNKVRNSPATTHSSSSIFRS